ncbi:MAG: V-type ATP synthase subunit E family protein, partial [Candidatus Micrarchaeota archaeon]
MGLNDLKKEMRKKAEKEAARLISEQKEKDSALLADARREGRRVVEEARNEVGLMVENERNEQIAAARLQAKKIINDAKEDVVERALEQAFEELKKLRDEKDYRGLLERLIKEGTREIGKDAVVYMNRNDVRLARGMGVKLADRHIECAGGALIESRDGRV